MLQFLQALEDGEDASTVAQHLHQLEYGVSHRLARTNVKLRIIIKILLLLGCGLAVLSMNGLTMRLWVDNVIFVVSFLTISVLLRILGSVADFYKWEVVPSMHSPFA